MCLLDTALEASCFLLKVRHALLRWKEQEEK
jgi:hypothetical protein